MMAVARRAIDAAVGGKMRREADMRAIRSYFRDGVAHFASPVSNDFTIAATPSWIRRQCGN
jgi:hypothetical protein